MTASQTRRTSFNDADLCYARAALDSLRYARGASDIASTWASDPRLRALAVRARAKQEDDIRAIRSLLAGWGHPAGATEPEGVPARPPQPGAGGTSDVRLLDRRELDRRLMRMLAMHAEVAIVSARTEMIDGFGRPIRRFAERAIRENSRDLGALRRLTASGTRPTGAEAG